MNVSMADSYNLAWKLTLAVSQNTPDSKTLLGTYVSERRLIAQQLIELDRRWYSIQWADSERKKQPDYQDECAKLYRDISGFTSGCGIQYSESIIVARPQFTNGNSSISVEFDNVEENMSLAPKSRVAKAGKRLTNSTMIRIADGCQWDMHDNLTPDGPSLKVLVFCGCNVLDKGSDSSQSLQIVFAQIVPQFSDDLLDAYVIVPETVRPHSKASTQGSPLVDSEVWTLLPGGIKPQTEMKTFCISKEDYDAYGMDINTGKVVVVRPDGIVAIVLDLDPHTIGSDLTSFLGRVIVMKST